MPTYRGLAAAGVATALVGVTALAVVAVGSSPAETTQPARTVDHRVPLATAVGGAVGPQLYPGLVSVHFDRSRAAFAASSAYVDAGRGKAARSTMRTAQAQAAASWVATKYLIDTTPPPPPAGDRVRANGAAAGSGVASPPVTSLAFFTLQHDLAVTATGLLKSSPLVQGRMVRTLRATAAKRDAAIEYIHTVAPPPPPPAEDLAGAGGAAVGTSFDSVMPSVLPFLDDEIATLQGTLVTYGDALPPQVAAALTALIARDTATEQTINTYWPPLPADD